MAAPALQPVTTARSAGLLARPGAIATLLLAPCLIWIFIFFLLPLGLMCWRSLASEGFSFAPYETLFTSPLYVKVLLTTCKMASIATVCALLLAYPIAYTLTMTSGKLRGAILLFILIPYWVDIIVRSFSWLIMLGDNGLINKALIGLGLVSEPLALLYNSFSVLVAMTQILLPITIVTLFGAMLRIDRTLMAAATIHGAGDWQVFRHVFFPLSLPGVYGAGLLAFILSLGFYVTPALLGSPAETMISQTIMIEANENFDYERASAAGVLLLLITMALVAVYSRYFGLDRLSGGGGR